MTLARSKFRFLAIVFGITLLVLQIFRFGFLAHFGSLADLNQPDTLRALYLGFKFDLRLVAILLMPAWLLLRPGMAVPQGWQRWVAPFALALVLAVYGGLIFVAMADDRAARPWLLVFLALIGANHYFFRQFGLSWAPLKRVWSTYSAFCVAILVLGYMVDVGAFGYIRTRLNGTLLMFMENAGTSLKVMWESYPFGYLTVLLIAVVGACLWGLSRLARGLELQELRPALWWTTNIAVTLGLLFAMYGKVSRYPLRWGECFEAKQGFNAQLGLNPLLFFLETRAEMDGGFDLAKVKALQPVLADYFGIPIGTDAKGLPTILRTIPARPQVTGTPNVVFIQLESFAGVKLGALGNPLNPTPFFDSLAAKSVFFDRFYVPMENTSRSMFCTLFGIPDVSAVQNATRNPLIIDQATPLHALNAYDKSFHLGGSANWAQIRGILKNNFHDLVLFEEGAFKAPVVDVWGVSDADLLLETQIAKTQIPGTP